MAVYELNPLFDSRWPDFLQVHPKASVFHTPGWLSALSLTYGYEPLVITTTPPDQPLQNGLVLCRINSWLTGSRLVSLPFSDHCEPLVEDHGQVVELLDHLRGVVGSKSAKYYELRPRGATGLGESFRGQTVVWETFCLHTLDLRSPLDTLFRNFHKSSVQQMVRRATREGLMVSAGRSDFHLEAFYKLLLLTRRRHQLPPQPFAWFHNLVGSCGDSLLIRLALKDGEPIASILTLSYKRTVVYKYGCSDARLHNLGATPFLLWDAIRDAKTNGAVDFDFGRSEPDNAGLIAFKDRWSGTRTRLTYYRYPAEVPEARRKHVRIDTARKAFSLMPAFCVTTAGRLLYRHIG